MRLHELCVDNLIKRSIPLMSDSSIYEWVRPDLGMNRTGCVQALMRAINRLVPEQRFDSSTCPPIQPVRVRRRVS